VQVELDKRITERLDYFISQGIKGADALLSAIGPALEVFGKYDSVEKITGEAVAISEFLDKVREVVARHALVTVLSEQELGKLDSKTAFYVLWKWTFEPRSSVQTPDEKDSSVEENEDDEDGEQKKDKGNHILVPYDEALKLSRSVGADVAELLKTRDLLEQDDGYVRLLGPIERKDKQHLGEITRDGTSPAIIDVIHRALNLWSAQEYGLLNEYLRDSGAGANETFWRVAQSLSNLLPLQSREKQMLDGLLVRHSADVQENQAGTGLTTLDKYTKSEDVD